MALSSWWLFVLMTFFISATPGPNMLFIMTASARHGLRAALAAMAGCMTALLLMLGLSAAGLGALLQSFPMLFDTLRLAGAAYLAYLGIQSWRAGAPVSSRTPASAGTQARALYRQSLLVAASNPKAILFAAAFFPQFLQPDAPQAPQLVILLATFSVIEVSWYFVYALSGQRLNAYLRQPTILRTFNRATGAVFVAFAGLMALQRH